MRAGQSENQKAQGVPAAASVGIENRLRPAHIHYNRQPYYRQFFDDLRDLPPNHDKWEWYYRARLYREHRELEQKYRMLDK